MQEFKVTVDIGMLGEWARAQAEWNPQLEAEVRKFGIVRLHLPICSKCGQRQGRVEMSGQLQCWDCFEGKE